MNKNVLFDYEKLNKAEKELYDSLPECKKETFEKKWIAKISAENSLKEMGHALKRESRKREERNKYKIGGLVMKYTGGKKEWSEEEFANLENYLSQYQNAIKSAIVKRDVVGSVKAEL